jgi:parvulin-like peptidyl-prolyl isomerase
MSLNSFGNKLRSGPLGAIFFSIVVVCVGVLAYTGIGSSIQNRGPAAAQAPATPSDVLATVDGTQIKVGEFQQALQNVNEQNENSQQSTSIMNAGSTRIQAFNAVLQPILMAQLAKENGFTMSDSEYTSARNAKLATIRAQLGLPANASEDAINDALQQYNQTIDDQIDRSTLKTNILSDKYRDYLLEKNQATDAVVQQFFRQVHVQHILIANNKRPDAQAQALAANLISRLKSGADFSTLAKQYSDDPGSKNKGGDDGFISQMTGYVPEFLNAALALQPGQITTTPVASPQYGYFIIKAIAVKTAIPPQYNKNKQQFNSYITNTLVQKQMQSALTAEQAKAKIVITDPQLRADLAFANLEQNNGGPSESPQAILADYNKSLTSADDSGKAGIYASESQVYSVLGQQGNEIKALTQALQNVEDSTARITLGELYRQKGDTADALTQFEAASDHAFSDQTVHIQLLQQYQSMKQTALAAKESAWLKTYNAEQKQATAQPAVSMPVQH